MSVKKIFFSIIIPVRNETDYLRQTLKKIELQSFKSYEILVITDKISQKSDPSFKRNLGAKKARGNYLCFLDDDSYPQKDWLLNLKKQIETKVTKETKEKIVEGSQRVFSNSGSSQQNKLLSDYF